jgi:hypothetical protein
MDSSDGQRNDPGRIAWGTVLIVFGLLLLAERQDLVRFHFGAQFWPFVLIALGVAKLAERPDPAVGRPHRSGGWLIFVGLWGLVTDMHVGGLNYRNSWPIFVIGVGVAIVWRALHRDPFCGKLGNRGNHAA